MNVSKLDTRGWPGAIEQIREFLDGTAEVAFSNPTDASALRTFVEIVLRRYRDFRLSKGPRGVLFAYMQRVTGYSRQHLSRLITQYRLSHSLKPRKLGSRPVLFASTRLRMSHRPQTSRSWRLPARNTVSRGQAGPLGLHRVSGRQWIHARRPSLDTIVFFGGFDSYIEELTSAFFYLRDAGYEVIAFEGPGQGGALNEAGLLMTAEWHRPVKAVLDYFELDRVTLAGLSMGGCLVFRAAAFEPRVERVVAYDIYPDSLDVNLRQVNPLLRGLLNALLNLRAAAIVNAMVKRVAKKRPVAEWGIAEGMHVTGTSSAYLYLKKIKQFNTVDVSIRITQDVLLLAGSEDHLVSIEHFYWQIKMLRNARSITGGLFTKSESGENHCQVGNYGLALRTIVNWLDGMQIHGA